MGLVDTLSVVLAEVVNLTPLAALGVGLVCIGAARGISAIGANAVEAIARQPEAKGAIQVNMIISAALIEGFTFFALIVCMQALIK